MTWVTRHHTATWQTAQHVVRHESKYQWLDGLLDIILHAAVTERKHTDVTFLFPVLKFKMAILSDMIAAFAQVILSSLAEVLKVTPRFSHLAPFALVARLPHVGLVCCLPHASRDVAPCTYSHNFNSSIFFDLLCADADFDYSAAYPYLCYSLARSAKFLKLFSLTCSALYVSEALYLPLHAQVKAIEGLLIMFAH